MKSSGTQAGLSSQLHYPQSVTLILMSKMTARYQTAYARSRQKTGRRNKEEIEERGYASWLFQVVASYRLLISPWPDRVIWLHIAARNGGKCSLYARRPYDQLKIGSHYYGKRGKWYCGVTNSLFRRYIHSIFKTILWERYYSYAHFTDGKTEA